MAERELAVVAGQDVEAEDRDRVDQRERDLEDPVVAERERQQRGQDQQREQRERRGSARPDRGAGARDGARPSAQTRRTTRRPNRPFGRSSSTSMISASATVSLRSVPTNGT